MAYCRHVPAAQGVETPSHGFIMRIRPAQRLSRSADSRSTEFETEALSLVDALYAMALRLTANVADAEDLVQETYLKAFRSARQFEPGTNQKAWMFTILHNSFLNARRQASRSATAVDSDVVERASESISGEGESPEDVLLREALDPDVRAALAAMPETFRQAVWLRDVEDFTYAEIARIMQVPVGTVMSRISRGRRWLHDALRRKAIGGNRAAVARAGGEGPK
jgi:RNA polymerase sigma-70 factor (ECF subfamily)